MKSTVCRWEANSRACGWRLRLLCFESCWKKWEMRTVIDPHHLFGDPWCTFQSHVRGIKTDINSIIQVLHWPLTLPLHGCERVQQVTLRYCCLQEENTGNVQITLYVYCGAFVLTLAGFEVFLKTLKSATMAWMWGNPNLRRYAATLVVHCKISLTINIALGERFTEFSVVFRTQWIN
jgi:hypothetical protein